MWSAWQAERNIFFNSFFAEQERGNLIVDPLPLSEDDAREIEARGGAAWIAITNRDHERAASACAVRFGARVAAGAPDASSLSVQVDRVLCDGDELCGARVVALSGLKTPGEFALYFRASRTVLVGDALWGEPAGALRLMPDDKLADPAAAALSLRRLRARRPRHLLVGDGACIFGTAFETITECLEKRGADVGRVNVEDLEFAYGDATEEVDVRREPAPYNGGWAEIGWLLGATKLGYAASRLAPGQALCPLHWHTAEEELCVVMEGTATLRTLHGEVALRRGDLVCFPTRPSGAHRLQNDGDGPCTLLLIANVDAGDVCFYPDSRKLYVEATGTSVRDHPNLDYFDGEPLAASALT